MATRQIPGPSYGAPKHHCTLKSLLGLFRGLSIWAKIKLLFRIIYAFVLALIVWTSKTIWKIIRSMKKVAIVIFILLSLLSLLFFSADLQRFLPKLIHPVILSWIVALLVVIVLKKLLGKTVLYKKRKVGIGFVPWIPMFVAAIFSLIYGIVLVAHIFPKLSEWLWWVLATVVVAPIVIYLIRKYAGTIVERYQTDLTVIGLSIFGIIALNCLIYFGTTAQPKIWQWYWGNQAFFWSWNIGWVIVAFLTSKRDDKGKTIPIASTIRSCVVLALFTMLAVNMFFHRLPGDNIASSNVPSQTTADKISTVMTLKIPAGGLQDGEKIVYEPIPIPAGGWGQEIENPHKVHHTDDYQIFWTPIGLEKGDCQMAINANLNKVYPCDAFIESGIRTFQFRSKSGKGFEIEIELKKKFN